MGSFIDFIFSIKLNCLDGVKKKDDVKKAWQIVTKGRYKEGYNNCLILPYKANNGGNFYMSKSIGNRDIDYGFL